jgi:predicted permease
MWSDLRLATRTWLRTPVLAAVVILTLALGIGATTTVFSLAHSVLVRPLPFPDVERLVWITSHDTRNPDTGELVANSNRFPHFIDWQQHLTTFDAVGAWAGRAAPDAFTVTGAGTPQRVAGLRVTQRLLPMLGARPALGRLFRDGDDANGASQTVVLSHGYWQRRFAGRSDIVGQSLTIGNIPHAVVGVLSPQFPLAGSLFAGAAIDVYLPLELSPEDIGAFMSVLGRLRPGVTIAQARAELDARRAAMAAAEPKFTTIGQQVTPMQGLVTRDARTPVLLLFAGIAAVLLMACLNLANLLLVRAGSRRREMQVRAALGATTAQVLRQTLAESAVVAVAGTAAGVGLALALTRIVRGASWLDLPRLAEVQVGWAAIAFALGVCAITTLVFGSVPLLHLRRRDIVDALRPHAGITGNPRAAHAQRLALVAQVTFAVALTVAGGLLFRSVVGLLRVDPGFEPLQVIAMRVDPAGRLAPPARTPFFNQLLGSVSTVPGVDAAALTMHLPMDRNMVWDVMIPGRPHDPAADNGFARLVSPGYFRTVGVRMIAGRDFDSRDQRAAPWVMAINQTLARRLEAMGQTPLDATFVVNGNRRQVIAVVADVKHQTLEGESGREFYIPYMQAPGFFEEYDLVVRASDPMALVPSIREAIWRVDDDQAIGTPVPLQQLIDRTLGPHRVMSRLLGAFAVTALLLAALGVYGVVGYRVAQRTKEIAIRVALGASRWRIQSAFLGETLLFVGLGVVLGVPLALGAGEAVRGYLFGVAPGDAVTIATACVAVVAAALAAAYLPARRAGCVDPIAALRAD